MQSLNENTTIKLGVDHNLTEMQMIEARFDLNQNILSVKEKMESRYGSQVAYMQLNLKDHKGNLISEMKDDMRTLGSYGAATGMIIGVIDFNPNSILKQIESAEGVEKYVMSDEVYDALPETFRKWKKEQLKNNPDALKKKVIVTQDLDPDYMGELASSILVGARCRLESGDRGEVSFVGKVVDLGAGWFVGVRLDEPFGSGNGCVKGVQYF